MSLRVQIAGGLLVTAVVWFPGLVPHAAVLAAVLAGSLLLWRPTPPRRPAPVTLARVPTRYEDRPKRRWSVGIGAGIGLFGPFIGLGFWRRRR